jgi:hypothetical protein
MRCRVASITTKRLKKTSPQNGPTTSRVNATMTGPNSPWVRIPTSLRSMAMTVPACMSWKYGVHRSVVVGSAASRTRTRTAATSRSANSPTDGTYQPPGTGSPLFGSGCWRVDLSQWTNLPGNNS